jgi:hypothetical protein
MIIIVTIILVNQKYFLLLVIGKLNILNSIIFLVSFLKVTEQEVINGILTRENNIEQTFAFIRKINNINIPLFAHSCKYIDINFAERKIDQEAIDLLAELRDRKVIIQ